ncbi:hypothetical protein L6164_012109 [Bauhinia variegata]|uniref:Uncharacterized protein n=1 Tax=Bauhinia variegata TaxID=167791 RepID=A0ACB9P8U6_BAUVA|nr:hypothetical protein L6164_012109 [Bauhinia variegata]
MELKEKTMLKKRNHHGHEEGYLCRSCRCCLHERSTGCHRSITSGSTRPFKRRRHQLPRRWIIDRRLRLVFPCLVPLSSPAIHMPLICYLLY